MQSRRWLLTGGLAVALLVGIGLRGWLASWHPFSNDEGAYLYDALQLQEGALPVGDGLVKTPVVLLLFALGVYVTDESLLAARVANILVTMIGVVPLFWLGYRAWDRTAALGMVFVWLLSSSTVIWYTLGHTQAIAAVASMAAVAMFLDWQVHVVAGKKPMRWQLLLVGVLWGVAIASRKTAIALGPALVVGWVLVEMSWRERWRQIEQIGIGAVSVLGVVGLGIWSVYGWAGVSELTGGGYTGIVTQYVRGSVTGAEWGVSLRWVGEVLRDHATLHIGLLVVAVGWQVQKRWLLWQSGREALLVLWVWLLSLGGLYLVWPTFLPEYIGDFLPVVTALGAIAIRDIGKAYHVLGQVGLLVIVGAGLTGYSFWQLSHQTWTGTFSSAAIQEMATELQVRVPINEPVATAAVIVPYVSGHRVWYDIGHPLWYSYEFIPSERRGVFLPPLSVVHNGIHRGAVPWLLNDHLTDFAYLRGERQLISELEERWQLVVEVPNRTSFRDNPLQLWRFEAVEGGL